MGATARAGPIQSWGQALPPALQCGFRVPSTWAMLCCLSRLQAGNWVGSGASGTQPGARMGCWRLQLKDQPQPIELLCSPLNHFYNRNFIEEAISSSHFVYLNLCYQSKKKKKRMRKTIVPYAPELVDSSS